MWPGLVLGQLDELAEPELRVPGRHLAAAAVPLVEMRQEDPQERRLQLVETRVVADEVEVGLVAGAVEREHADAVGELLVARRDEAAVAEAEEVLRREEAVRRHETVLRRLRERRRPAPHPRSAAHRAARASGIGAGRPKRCTGMIARVRAVTFAATSSGSRFSVTGSTSAKTGVAPRRAIDSAVA